jgi:hypothetical protein
VGFESTIPVNKRAKAFHALDRGATVIGMHVCKYVYTVYEVQSGRPWVVIPMVRDIKLRLANAIELAVRLGIVSDIQEGQHL